MKLILPIICVLFGTAANSQVSFTLSGHFQEPLSGKAILQYPDNENSVTDTIAVNNGAFVFSKTIKEPVLATLDFNGRSHRFFIEPGVIQITYSAGKEPKVDGGPIQREFENFMFSVKDVFQSRRTAYDTYWWKLPAGNFRDSIYDQYLSFQSDLMVKIKAYLKTHPQSLVGTWAVAETYEEASSTEFLEIMPLIQQEHSYGKRILYMYKLSLKSAVGTKINTLTAFDMNGRTISVSDMNAPYILIDFWASWCAPCRKEFNHLKELYRAYQNRGFEIVGFSIDDDRASWIRAVQSSGLDWIQLSDLKGGKGMAFNNFGVEGIPMNILIDKSHTIIARNLRGHQLDLFLSGLFSK